MHNRPLQRPLTVGSVQPATPHNLHTPIAAARIRKLFPDAKAIATLKEPLWRMRSAYNQFSAEFMAHCSPGQPADWCPVYKYYQLRLPTFAQAMQQEVAYMKGSGMFGTYLSTTISTTTCRVVLKCMPLVHEIAWGGHRSLSVAVAL